MDFAAYMAASDHDHKVRSAGMYADAVAEYFDDSKGIAGTPMPWGKTAGQFRFREAEVTLWAGFNGCGKSMIIGQCCIEFAQRGQKVCIASMEMRPHATLARMCRQASGKRNPGEQWARAYLAHIDPWIYLYDQIGAVNADKIAAVLRYAVDKLGAKHFVIDSLMKCGIAEDDFTRQKAFIDQLCCIARDTGVHVHLVAHSRKGQNETAPPGKMDVKGSGAITDQVDNVIVVWRNKPKERAIEEGGKYDPSEPDCLLICDKQRNGEWEGKIGLWYHRESWQYTAEHQTWVRPLVDLNAPKIRAVQNEYQDCGEAF